MTTKRDLLNELLKLKTSDLDDLRNKALLQEEDFYQCVVAHVMIKSIKQVTKEERNACKMLLFGYSYGISGAKLHEVLNEDSIEMTILKMKALHAKACQGKWLSHGGSVVAHSGREEFTICDSGDWGGRIQQEDADFIAAAHTAMPTLLRQLEAFIQAGRRRDR
jgi:hypothetical protein